MGKGARSLTSGGGGNCRLARRGGFSSWIAFILCTLVLLALMASERRLLLSKTSFCGSQETSQGNALTVAAPAKPPATAHQSIVFRNNTKSDIYENFCVNNTLDDCFDTLWPQVKATLCPAMVPNTDFTDVLFSIARDQIGLRPWNGTDQSLELFYKLTPDAFVYTSPENKTMIYMSIWKAAHESILKWARRHVNPLAGNYRVLQRRKLAPILQETPNACIVTVIRDPISHFLSGYNEMDTRIHDDEYTIQNRMKDTPKGLFHRYHYGTKQRFQQFVADILSSPETLGWNRLSRIQPLHIYSMSAVLTFLAENKSRLTTFLPSIDNLAEKWPAFAVDACPGILPENMKQVVDIKSSTHDSSRDEFGIYQAAKDVWKEGGPTARALCVLHAMDYACWENLPDGIPALCKQVYSSSNFVKQNLLLEEMERL